MKKYAIRKTLVGAGSILIGTGIVYSDVNTASASNETIVTNIDSETTESKVLKIPYVNINISEIDGVLTKDQENIVIEEFKKINNLKDDEFNIEFSYETIIVTRPGELDFMFTTFDLKDKPLLTKESIKEVFKNENRVNVKNPTALTKEEKAEIFEKIKKHFNNENITGLTLDYFNGKYYLKAKNLKLLELTVEDMTAIVFSEPVNSNSSNSTTPESNRDDVIENKNEDTTEGKDTVVEKDTSSTDEKDKTSTNNSSEDNNSEVLNNDSRDDEFKTNTNEESNDSTSSKENVVENNSKDNVNNNIKESIELEDEEEILEDKVESVEYGSLKEENKTDIKEQKDNNNVNTYNTKENIVVATKELPKTNTNNTYMYTLTSLVGLSLLLKRKLSTK